MDSSRAFLSGVEAGEFATAGGCETAGGAGGGGGEEGPGVEGRLVV